MTDGVAQVKAASSGRVVGHALFEQAPDGSHVAHIVLSAEATSPASEED